MALDQYQEEEEGMSFLDHLEALRWHLLRSVAAILIFTVAAFLAKSIVFGVIILGPSKVDFFTYRVLCDIGNSLGISALCIDELPFTIQSRQMTGQFSMHMTSSFVVGFIAAFPYVFWEVWKFISPALYEKERKYAVSFIIVSSFLFFVGVLFGYYLIAPLSVQFFASYIVSPEISNSIDINSYISLMKTSAIASGLLFELPIIIFFLTKIGLVTPEFLRKYRKYTLVIVLIVAAVITPPDVLSQIIVSIPIMILYEASILISVLVVKSQEREKLKA